MAGQQAKDDISTALKAYSLGQQDTTSTAKALVAPVNKAYASGESGDVSALLEILWAGILEAIRAAPDPSYKTGTAPEQNLAFLTQYVNLLDTIRQSPDPASPSSDKLCASEGNGAQINDNNDNGGLWSGLEGFGMNAREDFNHSPASSSKDAYSPEAWMNLNSFLALLTSKHTPPPPCFDFFLYAIWCLRDALETSQNPETTNAIIPAAAAWIDVPGSGTMIYNSTRKWQPDAKTGAPARTGPLWEEGGTPREHGFSKERWLFWQQRFGQVGDDKNLSQDARDTARSTVVKMKEIGTGVSV
ncbi:hypothetical protein H2198_006037 [Neophaeococcomyces mojaviensis]|uniref:Uncharacterized protein n=1 Tax=Neophaeococcomyces mojaviensis TaxID=3383035 RepID=A0ACC3A410_9EURO|nr:hypothetical protein H2198_006037 [Knufia sp. JES_112]